MHAVSRRQAVMMGVFLPIGLEDRPVVVAAAVVFQFLVRDDGAVGVIVHVNEFLARDLEQMHRQVRLAQNEGLDTVLIAPMVAGVPTLQALVRAWPEVAFFAHPTFGGATRIAPELLYGKLFPLYGADATIFANFGGRFSYSRETCRKLADALTTPDEPGLLPTLPMPAGGIKYQSVSEVLAFYGAEVILLIGGGLYEAGDDSALYTRAVEFVRHVAEFKP